MKKTHGFLVRGSYFFAVLLSLRHEMVDFCRGGWTFVVVKLQKGGLSS